jgi:DNA-binding MarR family transcriptional regulator
MTHRIALPDGFAERWPRGDRLGTQLIMNVVLTGELAVTRIARLTRHLGVSSAGGLTLSILSEAGALSPSQISDRLIVTRAAVTNVIVRSS